MRERKHGFDRVILLAPLVRPMRWQLGKVAHMGLSRFRDHMTR